MTMKEKECALAIYAYAIAETEKKIAITENALADARARRDALNAHIDKLERRQSRQRGKLRRMHENKESVANEIDEYDEFCIIAEFMTA